MFERLEQIEARYEGLGRQLADPAVLGDHAQYQKLAKQHRDLEPVVEKFREYRQVKTGIADARGMLTESDAEIRAMAQEELTALEARGAAD
jgi:peptide chain release factor 1